jgi:methylase of polypeptide subunit release factors
VAHLVGEREFWSLPLYVSAATLIPRPDTECLVEQALARLPAAACRILDLGPGPGYRAGARHRTARLRGDGGGCDARCGGAGAA